MVKQSLIKRGLKKYTLSKKYLNKRISLKNKFRITKNLLDLFYIQKYFQQLPKNSTFIRFKRFCWQTGRNRGYYRNFALSRHILREMAHDCKLPGITKASW